MKNTLSLLLALMAVVSMSLSAFALETDTMESVTEEITLSETVSNGLSLGTAVDSELTLSGLLNPNQTLRFPVMITDENSETVQLNEKLMENKRIRVETESGRSAIRSIKMVEEDGLYYLEVSTLSGYPTKISSYIGQLTLSDKSNGKVLHSLPLSFSVGYHTVSDEALESAKNGEYLLLDNTAPVITDKQFNTIDKVANGDKIIIAGDGWTYEVRVTEQPSVNLLSSQKIIKEIVTQFEDQEFKFLSFPAGSVFDFTGTMTIDVSREMEDFGGEFYVYSYYNGKLNRIHATFDEEMETLSFPTKYMARFVITDKEIKNGTIIEDCSADCDDSASKPSKPSDSAKPNPETGANDLPVQLAIAAASLSAGCIVACGMKKR